MKHRIMRPAFLLTLDKRLERNRILEETRYLFYEQLVPVLEEALDEVSSEDELVRYEQLEVDLGLLDPVDWKNELIGRFKSSLHKILEQSGEKSSQVLTISEGDQEALIYFLENGVLPWWMSDARVSDLITKIVRSPGKFGTYLSDRKDDHRLIKRLFSSAGKEDHEALMVLLAGARIAKAWFSLIRVISKYFDLEDEDTFQRFFLLALAEDVGEFEPSKAADLLVRVFLLMKTDPQRFQPLYRKLMHPKEEGEGAEDKILVPVLEMFRKKMRSLDEVADEAVLKLQEPDEPEQKTPSKAPMDDIYIDNAGLVLVYPFLEEFFERLGLTKEKKFRNPASREKAVRLLDFLGNRNRHRGEEHLALCKILCGMEPHLPVFHIPGAEDETLGPLADEILKTIAGSWPGMEKTSPEALRETYLEREGKLSTKEGNWTLTVERKTVDILLERLPWTLSVVKLPWMEKILFVRW